MECVLEKECLGEGTRKSKARVTAITKYDRKWYTIAVYQIELFVLLRSYDVFFCRSKMQPILTFVSYNFLITSLSIKAQRIHHHLSTVYLFSPPAGSICGRRIVYNTHLHKTPSVLPIIPNTHLSLVPLYFISYLNQTTFVRPRLPSPISHRSPNVSALISPIAPRYNLIHSSLYQVHHHGPLSRWANSQPRGSSV